MLSEKDRPIRHVKGSGKDFTRLKTRKFKWNTTKEKVTPKEVNEHMGIIKSYFYKEQAKLNKNMLTKYSSKAQAEKQKAIRIKRLSKLESEHGINFHKMLQYSMLVTGRIMDSSLLYDKKDKGNFDRRLTKAFKVAKLGAFKDFGKLIDSNSKMLEDYKKKLAVKFMDRIDKYMKHK